jgi:hypothetical protein
MNDYAGEEDDDDDDDDNNSGSDRTKIKCVQFLSASCSAAYVAQTFRHNDIFQFSF